METTNDIPKHVNKELLPAVGPNVFVKYKGQFVKMHRRSWAKSNKPCHVDFHDKEGNLYQIKLKELEWFYP